MDFKLTGFKVRYLLYPWYATFEQKIQFRSDFVYRSAFHQSNASLHSKSNFKLKMLFHPFINYR